MDKIKRIRRDYTRISVSFKGAARELALAIKQVPYPSIQAELLEKTADLVHAGAAEGRVRESNRKTEKSRRVTVGARVRRCDAERYRHAAAMSGRSVYRFVVDALERECARTGENEPPGPGPGG